MIDRFGVLSIRGCLPVAFFVSTRGIVGGGAGIHAAPYAVDFTEVFLEVELSVYRRVYKIMSCFDKTRCNSQNLAQTSRGVAPQRSSSH